MLSALAAIDEELAEEFPHGQALPSPAGAAGWICPACAKPIPPFSEDHAQITCSSCGQRISRAKLSTLVLARDGAAVPPWPPTPERSSTCDPASVIGSELLGKLGRGGMGVVYKARQVQANRLVALKMIRPDRLADLGPEERQQYITRFQTEAEVVARLQHPNIVQVFEVGEHEGLPFFSMEFVAGNSLAQKYSGTPLPAHEAPMNTASSTAT